MEDGVLAGRVRCYLCQRGNGYPGPALQAVQTPEGNKAQEFSRILNNIKAHVTSPYHLKKLEEEGKKAATSGDALQTLCSIAYENVTKGASFR